MGAKVCSEPAIDREFGVIDFLIVLDVERLDERTRKRMFGTAAQSKNGPTGPLGRLGLVHTTGNWS
jgi:putative hemolysin